MFSRMLIERLLNSLETFLCSHRVIGRSLPVTQL